MNAPETAASARAREGACVVRHNPLGVPDELKARDQWVAFAIEERGGKLTKPPYSAQTGGYASHSRSSTWAPYHDAFDFYERRDSLVGVGYVFTADDPYTGIDLDHCRNPETGAIEPWAADYLRRFNSYAEVSPSGTGIKIFVRGVLRGGGRKKSGLGNGDGAVEVYDRQRYFTVTGHRVEGMPAAIEDRQDELDAFAKDVFGQPAATTAPRADFAGEREVVQRAMDAGNGAKLRALWSGDDTGYDGDESAADLAFCRIASFWTGADPQRIDAWMRASSRMRPKWDEVHYGDRRTYGQGTIEAAIAAGGEHYRGSNGGSPASSIVSRPAPSPLLVRSPWQAKPLDEWLNAEDGPLDVVIGDGADGAILPIDGKGFIAGPTGIGKTNLLLRLGRCLCEGVPFLGLPVPQRRTVLHVALEGSGRGLRKRLKKVWAGASAEARARFFIGQLQVNLAELADVDRFDLLLAEIKPCVVILDPLRNAHTLDENSSQDVAALTSVLDGIIARHSCAVVAAHHDRKKPPLTKRDGGTDRVRGSTALAGWLSFCLSIEKDSKLPDTLIGEWTKVRDAEEALPELVIEFDREAIDFSASERSPASKISDDDVLTPVYHAGRDGVRGDQLREIVRTKTGAGDRTVKDRVRDLVKAGDLVEFIADEDRRQRAKSYRLPQEGED